METQKLPPAKRLAILLLLAEGLTYNEIAEKMELSRGTIKNHVRLLYKDFDIANAEQAVQKGKVLELIK